MRGIYFSYEVLSDLCLIVEVRKHFAQEASDQCRLVMGCRIQHHQGNPSHIQIRVLKSLQEVTLYHIGKLMFLKSLYSMVKMTQPFKHILYSEKCQLLSNAYLYILSGESRWELVDQQL